MRPYFTVIVPWSPNPSRYHPTETSGPLSVLSRGNFDAFARAVDWAKANLDGQPYSISVVDDEGVRPATADETRKAEAAIAEAKANAASITSRTEAGRARYAASLAKED